MTTRDLRDEFRRDPSLSILLSDDVFRKAIRKGIEEGSIFTSVAICSPAQASDAVNQHR